MELGARGNERQNVVVHVLLCNASTCTVTLYWLALSVDEEFFKVPTDIVATQWTVV